MAHKLGRNVKPGDRLHTPGTPLTVETVDRYPGPRPHAHPSFGHCLLASGTDGRVLVFFSNQPVKMEQANLAAAG